MVIILGFQLVIWGRIRSTTGACSSQVGGDYVEKAQSCPSVPLLLITGGILLTLHTVPTEVVKWKADYEFVPLNATQFLDPKVQTKWESLYPGSPFPHMMTLLV